MTGGINPAERADSTSTPPCRNIASSAVCCLIDPALQLGGLLRVLHAHHVAHFSRRTELAGSLIFVHLPYFSWTSRPGSKPMCNEMNADVPPLLAAEAAPAPLLLLRIHPVHSRKTPKEIPVHVAPIFGPEYRVNTRSTSRAEHPPAVPDPRNPGPESELSRVCRPRSLPGSRIPESLVHLPSALRLSLRRLLTSTSRSCSRCFCMARNAGL